jgi:hypothetical protein
MCAIDFGQRIRAWYVAFDLAVAQLCPNVVTHVGAWQALYMRDLTPTEAADIWVREARPLGERWERVRS